MTTNPEPKAALSKRYPLSSVVIYNASTVLHYLIGTIGIMVGFAFSPTVALIFGIAYLIFAFAEMYIVMPFKVCPNCVYYQMADSLCISGLNLVSKKFAKQGHLKDFPVRAEGLFCFNNMYLAALGIPILAIGAALFLNYSLLLLVLFLTLIGLLVYRFFIIFPKIACLHCHAKYQCPQAGSMGVRER